jgi:hypothetical protein
MTDRPFASQLCRRSSLVGLGGAVFAALAASSTAARKRTKKRKRDANTLCKKQQIRCEEPVLAMCARNDIPLDVCERSFLDCCQFFATCNAAQALACLDFGAPGDPV